MSLHNKRIIGTIGIMAGLPCVLEEFSWSLARMIDYTNHYVCGSSECIELLRSPHSFHSLARNALEQHMRGDWLLQLDTDHSFDPDLLARLLNVMTKYDSPSYPVDIVGGMYLKKSHPHVPTVWQWTGEEDRSTELLNWPDGEILEVGVIGTGCLLVRRRVFDRIRAELKEEPFSTSEFPGVCGEDFAFARRCKKLGIRMLVDPKIECYHLKVSRVTVDDHYPPAVRPGME